MTKAGTPGPARAATIYDVAKMAGISHQTVSRLLKGHGVAPDTRERIERAIEHLGYRPNAAARSLATRKSHRIGALMYEMTQLGPMRTMESASTAAREAGYLLDIVQIDPRDEQSLMAAIEVVNQQDLAGILAFAPNDAMRNTLSAAQFRVPVFTEAENGPGTGPEEPIMSAYSARLATTHLVDLGHRRIVHISGPLDWPSARWRARGYADVMVEHGLAALDVYEGDWTAETGYRAARRILAEHPDVSAIFSANDHMALGAMRALWDAGIGIPDDISIIGMDDLPESQFYLPALTSVPMNFAAQGRFAFESLLATIENRPSTMHTALEPTTVVARASTARFRG